MVADSWHVSKTKSRGRCVDEGLPWGGSQRRTAVTAGLLEIKSTSTANIGTTQEKIMRKINVTTPIDVITFIAQFVTAFSNSLSMSMLSKRIHGFNALRKTDRIFAGKVEFIKCGNGERWNYPRPQSVKTFIADRLEVMKITRGAVAIRQNWTAKVLDFDTIFHTATDQSRDNSVPVSTETSQSTLTDAIISI